MNIEQLAALPKEEVAAFLEGSDPAALMRMRYDWKFWARPEQLEPASDILPAGPWWYWIALAGRGWGKTKSGSEWVRERKNVCGRIAIVAETAADARDVVVDGASGIMACSPPWDKPTFEPSKRRITWENGAYATLYSGEDPEQLRGPQHSAAWVDEFAKYRYAQQLWDQLKFGLRLRPTDGTPPRAFITAHKRCVTVVRSTYDNMANLADEFLEELRDTYEGTTLGEQEIHAAILDEAKGALWRRATLEGTRLEREPEQAFWKRTVVGVDPQTVAQRGTTGIVGASLGQDNHGYIRGDASGGYSPNEWAKRAVDLYFALEADTIVAEGNQGGDMVKQTIESFVKAEGLPHVNVKVVWARHGKQARAEPIASRYEQGKVHHIGTFAMLESQMVTWEPESKQPSPDRLDAMVWALTELMISHVKRQGVGMPTIIPILGRG
jgi:phage terminase large subunit-like protein